MTEPRQIFAQHHTIQEVIEILDSGEPVLFSDEKSIQMLRKWLHNWACAQQGIEIARSVLSDDYESARVQDFRFYP